MQYNLSNPTVKEQKGPRFWISVWVSYVPSGENIDSVELFSNRAVLYAEMR